MISSHANSTTQGFYKEMQLTHEPGRVPLEQSLMCLGFQRATLDRLS